MTKVCLVIGDVIITNDIPCDTLAVGEMLVVNGQCFIVDLRYCTVGFSGSCMTIRAYPTEWNGQLSKIDREFWKFLRQNADPDSWHWSGRFPQTLSDLIIEEQQIKKQKNNSE